ncbi:hypothetical protein RND71_025358 [Anisodus tanguticus]|uniref:Uncharacterized protein n=1 Tax=Anisodus tanguticus TaxID=243964 RepID=A0AAE1RSW3_9SOLA|nr:hypothetical protein RND71_025358 [Anisodus tanguticus]
MAATVRVRCVVYLFAILSIQHCICADTPENSPAPAPEAGGYLGSPPPSALAPESPTPSPLSNVSSPPAPPPADRSPDSAPAPSLMDGDNATPSPAPSDVSHESTVDADESSSDGGMNGGKKAGVAFGVIAAACVVGLGALVYKKRRQNIRRAQFGYAARRDFL